MLSEAGTRNKRLNLYGSTKVAIEVCVWEVIQQAEFLVLELTYVPRIQGGLCIVLVYSTKDGVCIRRLARLTQP